jgi:prepilin-type N-terminal cleavage/methylation domain-containing protein
MSRRGQRGFTLIELMVALVVSSLLVAMILAIFSRMSLAYRGQQQIAGVQQVLAAARTTIELDAKQAGLAMPQGFTIAQTGSSTTYSPVQIINSSTGPDQIAFYYADTTTQAVVTNRLGWPALQRLKVDQTSGFADGDLVVMSTLALPSDDPKIELPTYKACILRIATGGVATNTLTFETTPPWGNPDVFQYCGSLPVPWSTDPGATTLPTMIYKFVAHAYRIDPDPARTAIGPLQGSLITGNLPGTAAGAWTDLAYGFTDIQTALQVNDGRGIDTPDPGTEPNLEWYSGDNQTELTDPLHPNPPTSTLLQMSISLVARTDRSVEGVATTETPNLVVNGVPNVDGTPANNPIGDHPSVTLPWATDPTIPGRVYRATTFRVDFRNLGVGQ